MLQPRGRGDHEPAISARCVRPDLLSAAWLGYKHCPSVGFAEASKRRCESEEGSVLGAHHPGHWVGSGCQGSRLGPSTRSLLGRIMDAEGTV